MRSVILSCLIPVFGLQFSSLAKLNDSSHALRNAKVWCSKMLAAHRGMSKGLNKWWPPAKVEELQQEKC